jgi:glycosyltransferase involved in cell wall biosynthesis
VVRRIAFAVPGDLAAPTGGYAYDRRIIAELELLGWPVDIVRLGDGFPWPDDNTRAAAQARLLAVPTDQPIVIDGLAFGVLPEAGKTLRSNRQLIAVVHHPLALESGLSSERIEVLRDSERTALACATRVIVTSSTTARHLVNNYAVPGEHIVVARPGTDPVRFACGSSDGVIRLVSVGSVVPRKGYDILIAALAILADLPWRLWIVGDCGRDPKSAEELLADIATHRLGDRAVVLGAIPPQRLEILYSEADIFVLASRFEGYGMAYAEAIAHGVPVIGTTAGAIAETVPSGAGILVCPNNVDALAQAIRRMIENPTERRQLAAGARQAASQLPRWPDSAKIFASVLETVA